EGLCYPGAKSFEALPTMRGDYGTERSDRSLHGDEIGDDVCRMSSIHETNRNDNRIASIRLSRNCLIDERDEVGRGCNRIDRRMRSRPVAATSAHLDDKILAVRRPRSGRDSDVADVESRINV